MGTLLKSLALAYSAGTLGGIANYLVGAFLAASGILAALKIGLPSPPMPLSLYSKMIWGGIWGAILFLPIGGNLLTRGFWLGLAPTLVAGLVVLPAKLHRGYFAVDISPLMPVIMILVNWVWGVVTVWTAQAIGLR